MILRDYIKMLNARIKEDPSILALDVITSMDDEGNGLSLIHI